MWYYRKKQEALKNGTIINSAIFQNTYHFIKISYLCNNDTGKGKNQYIVPHTMPTNTVRQLAMNLQIELSDLYRGNSKDRERN